MKRSNFLRADRPPAFELSSLLGAKVGFAAQQRGFLLRSFLKLGLQENRRQDR